MDIMANRRPARSWLSVLILLVHLVCLIVCQNEPKCGDFAVLEPSTRPPLQFDALVADIEKIETKTTAPASNSTSGAPGGTSTTISQPSTSSTLPSSQPSNSSTSPPSQQTQGQQSNQNDTKFILNYGACALSGDRDGLKGAVSAITLAITTASEAECAKPTDPTNVPAQMKYDQCKGSVVQFIASLRALSGYALRKHICPKWLSLLNENRKIFPSDKMKNSVMSQGALEPLLEYLSNPDFQFDLCRTTDTTAFPLCVEELGCGYLKASAIDYTPDLFTKLVENTCKYVLQAVSELEKDSAFQYEYALEELRKDCGSHEFFNSFQCLSVNVKLRKKLKLYVGWFLDHKDGKLSKHLKKLRSTLKGEASALLADLSKRFRFKIPKIGDDCSGSVDSSGFWERSLEYVNATPDGTLPYDFLSKIPIEEQKVIEVLKKTCDVSQDLVCGDGCVCVCPKGDKWRTCNGRGAQMLISRWSLMLSSVLIIVSIKY